MSKSDTPTRVQISYEMYIELVLYFFDENERTAEREERIKNALQSKAEAMKRHNVYTCYKNSENPTERENARLQYLELANISEAFRQ